MSKLIYLASPYSKYPKGRVAAFEEICEKAAHLMLEGHNVFCPIAHSHPIEDLGMVDRGTHDFWLKQDFAVLERCDELFVYKMPSWEESYGVTKEIEFAQKNNIPVTYLDYE
jgi:hypothetical protein